MKHGWTQIKAGREQREIPLAIPRGSNRESMAPPVFRERSPTPSNLPFFCSVFICVYQCLLSLDFFPR
jgi:hypothetical protein